MSVTTTGHCGKSGENEEQGKEEVEAAAGSLTEVLEAQDGSNTDSDSDLETEGIHSLGELVTDTLYLRSCQAYGAVPVSCFLRQGRAPELNLRYRGLGPQGARALASALTSNPYVKRLDLRDNGLCAAGAVALARALRKSSSIRDVDLSENQLGAVGAQVVCAALMANPAIRKVQLAGNSLEEQAAQYLAELLLAHTGLNSLDLSYNQLNDQAGPPDKVRDHRQLLRALEVSEEEESTVSEREPVGVRPSAGHRVWNPVLGAAAQGCLGALRELSKANIFLRVLDISYNGFGDPGASAVGEALRTNNMLEELNMSNNHISVVGALSLGLGLRVNQTLRILVVSRNPMRSEGCLGVLKSVQANPVSPLELLDFSDIQVNREFDDLASSVKVILPGLCIKTDAGRVEYRKEFGSLRTSVCP